MRTNSHAPSFADLCERPLKTTRTATFLKRMNSLLDLSFTETLHEAIHTSEVGRAPYCTKLLFKILLLQQWYGLSDSETEEQIYERKSFQEFLGLGKEDPIPDESTIGKFRNKLQELMTDITFFEEIMRQLSAHGVMWKSGASVDATIVETSKGRKRKDGSSTRDVEASFTRKNSRSYHGYKHTTKTSTDGKYIKDTFTSTAKDHDSKHENKVLDGTEDAVFEDSAYVNKEKKRDYRRRGIFYGVIERATRGHPLSSSQKKRNHKLSSVRCRTEHPYAEIKIRMNFKARYRGLRKNSWHFRMTAAAYNLKRFVGEMFPAQKQALVWCA